MHAQNLQRQTLPFRLTWKGIQCQSFPRFLNSIQQTLKSPVNRPLPSFKLFAEKGCEKTVTQRVTSPDHSSATPLQFHSVSTSDDVQEEHESPHGRFLPHSTRAFLLDLRWLMLGRIPCPTRCLCRHYPESASFRVTHRLPPRCLPCRINLARFDDLTCLCLTRQ